MEITLVKSLHNFILRRFTVGCERFEEERNGGVICPTCSETNRRMSEPDKGPPITGQQRAGGKKYRLCTECGKSVQNLAKHLKMHRGVKPDRWVFILFI
jgi:hypothetical protein